MLVTNFVEAEKFGDSVATRIDFIDRPTFSEKEAFIGTPVKAAGSPGGAVQIKLRWAFSRALPLVRNISGLEFLDTLDRTVLSSVA